MGPEIPVFVIFFLLLSLIVGFLFLRYRRRELQHRERMVAMEKGAPLPDLVSEGAPWSPRVYLLRGMIWLFSGAALTVFLAALIVSANSRKAPTLEDRLLFAHRMKALGATDEQIKQSEGEINHDAPPFGVALLGLVPIGVGAAYLIYYRVEGKRVNA